MLYRNNPSIFSSIFDKDLFVYKTQSYDVWRESKMLLVQTVENKDLDKLTALPELPSTSSPCSLDRTITVWSPFPSP